MDLLQILEMQIDEANDASELIDAEYAIDTAYEDDFISLEDYEYLRKCIESKEVQINA